MNNCFFIVVTTSMAMCLYQYATVTLIRYCREQRYAMRENMIWCDTLSIFAAGRHSRCRQSVHSDLYGKIGLNGACPNGIYRYLLHPSLLEDAFSADYIHTEISARRTAENGGQKEAIVPTSLTSIRKHPG